MKKILITGGSGFIGKNICESYLNEKYELIAPTRQQLDCSDDASVARFFGGNQVDVVIHSAAKPGHRNAADTTSIFFTNSRMLFNLLQYCDRWGKFINMGSGAIYDMRHYTPKMPEDYFGKHIPVDEHGYNKYLFGKVLPTLSNVYDFRIFGIFGKYEDYAIRFISNAICKAMFGLPITLRQNRMFDYLYVNDLYPILEHFIEGNPVDKAYNVTPDNAVALLHLAEMVRELSGNDMPIQVASEGMGLEYSGSNARLRQEMNSLNFTPIAKAVSELYNWYAERKGDIVKERLLVDK